MNEKMAHITIFYQEPAAGVFREAETLDYDNVR